jgi:TP901 family phage tail tape measure protein
MSNRTIEAILRLSAKLGSMRAFDQMAGKLDHVDRKARAFNRSQGAMARGAHAVGTAISRFAAPAVLAYGAKEAIVSYAEIERRINRIGITADASAEKTKGVLANVEQIAKDTAMPVDQVVAGLETLVASGQSLDEAMSFLPSVVKSAQAAGAETADLATTADAVSRSLQIAGDKAQLAFDIMAKGGKAGKFELKDMAQYLPSIIPAFSAMGYKGEAALGKLVSMLQTVRNYTGDSSEAATALQNVFQKMESEETVKKFSKFGIDLRKEMVLARKEGRDLIDTFIELSLKATKGDLSKLPQIFSDAQFLAGMRALINGRDATKEMATNLRDAAGTVETDFNRLIGDTTSKLTKLSSTWDKLLNSVGAGLVDSGVVDTMGAVADRIDYQSAMQNGLKREGVTDYLQQLIYGMTASQSKRDGLAWAGGYRTDEQRKQIKTYSVLREQAATREPTFGHKIVDGVPVPVPSSASGPTSVYSPLMPFTGVPNDLLSRKDGGGHQIQERMAQPFEPLGAEFEAKLQRGGAAAGQSIEDAAMAINSAGQEAGSSFRSMLEGVGRQIGIEAAAAFRTNVGAVSIRANLVGSSVRADTGVSRAGRATE